MVKTKKAGARYIDVRPKKAARSLDVGDLMARELKRVERLARESERVRRRLSRAKMRYGVLKRLADDSARRSVSQV